MTTSPENKIHFDTERNTMKISYLDDAHRERFEDFLCLPFKGNDVLAIEYIMAGQPDFFNSFNSFVKALITGRGFEEAEKNIPPTTEENKLLFMLMEDIAFGTSKMKLLCLGNPETCPEKVLFLSVNALLLLRKGKAAIGIDEQQEERV